MSTSASDMARALRERALAARHRSEERASHLGTLLPRAAECLRRHGATQVWLFGSLAEGRPSLESDVDLAVEGLPAATYFDALAEVTELLGTRVDLVRVEQAPASLRQRIAETGVPV